MLTPSRIPRLALLLTATFRIGVLPSAQASKPPPNVAGGQSFLQQFERLADKKPIPVVAIAIGKGLTQSKPALLIAEKPLKDSLQAIGDTYSQPERTDIPKAYQTEFEARREVYIPFKFDRVWTVARDLQWVVNVDPPMPDPLEAVAPRDLVRRSVTTLTEQQIRIAGSPGLKLSDLSPGQQAVFRAAFRGTNALQHMLPPDPGSYESKFVTDFDGALPLEDCVLHVYTAWNDIVVWDVPKPGERRIGQGYPFLPHEGRMVFPHNEGAAQGYSVPTVYGTPAKLKPSDLDFESPALTAPIGLSGITRVEKIVEAAATLSHLNLRVDPRYAPYETFIGDATLSTGDVLRAVTFDLQAAWRKVGKTYLLTFDRIGLAAMRTYLEERLLAADRHTNAVMSELLKSDTDETGWAVSSLPLLAPDPDGPPGPTPEQMKFLLSPYRDRQDEDSGRSLLYDRLTPAQQEAVRKTVTNLEGAPGLPPAGDPRWEAIIHEAKFTDLNLRVVLEVPKVGRFHLLDVLPTFFPSSLASEQAKRLGRVFYPERKVDAGEISLKPATKGVAVPPLPPSEWPRLLDQMRRKGLTVLYVPVLWEGQALFPSKRFPLRREARGKDALASVCKLAKARGVKVIGLLDVLAWRHPDGTGSHWVTKSPEMLDVDVLGRTRGIWTQQYGPLLRGDVIEAMKALHITGGEHVDLLRLDPLPLSDMARPDDPSVVKRLSGFLDELRTYPLDGVAFSEWSRLSASRYVPPMDYMAVGQEVAPALGYTEAEREAFLMKEGVDPVDFSSTGYQRISIPYAELPGDRQGALDRAWAATRQEEDAALVKALTVQAHKTWPKAAHLFFPFEPYAQEEGKRYPTGDVTVRRRIDLSADPSAVYDWVAPVSAYLARAEEAPDTRLTTMWRAIAQRAEMNAVLKKPTSAGIVLDFRNAPDLLWDGLRRLANAQGDVNL